MTKHRKHVSLEPRKDWSMLAKSLYAQELSKTCGWITMLGMVSYSAPEMEMIAEAVEEVAAESD